MHAVCICYINTNNVHTCMYTHTHTHCIHTVSICAVCAWSKQISIFHLSIYYTIVVVRLFRFAGISREIVFRVYVSLQIVLFQVNIGVISGESSSSFCRFDSKLVVRSLLAAYNGNFPSHTMSEKSFNIFFLACILNTQCREFNEN